MDKELEGQLAALRHAVAVALSGATQHTASGAQGIKDRLEQHAEEVEKQYAVKASRLGDTSLDRKKMVAAMRLEFDRITLMVDASVNKDSVS
jgi:hypothetical protein